VGTGDVGLSATAFPSFQGPWAGLDVPGDIWLATTAPALPTRTQHAVSTARLHPSFLPSGVSRTIEPRQAGRPVAGRPARGGPKRHPRLGGQPRQRHAVLDMRAQQVPAALRLAACARSASPAPAARARAAGSSTAGEPTSSRAQVVAGNAGFPATTGPGRTGSGPAEPHRRPRPASSTCTHSLRQTLLEAPSWARHWRDRIGHRPPARLRRGDPAALDVAHAVAFYASDEASFITGQTVSVKRRPHDELAGPERRKRAEGIRPR